MLALILGGRDPVWEFLVPSNTVHSADSVFSTHLHMAKLGGEQNFACRDKI